MEHSCKNILITTSVIFFSTIALHINAMNLGELNAVLKTRVVNSNGVLAVGYY